MDAVAAASPVALLTNMNKANKAKCRACLSADRDVVKLDAKVPELQHPRTYGQSFRHCTGLTLNTASPGGYKWPMQMCVRCCRALEVAMHFVEMAIESDRALHAEAQSVKPPTKPEPEQLKRKASSELQQWNQFSQEFEQFVGNYTPIEENVLYMRGAKMPRLEETTVSNKPPKEDEVILFDVKYDTNNIDEEDENDGSDAKNDETFFDSTSILNNGGDSSSVSAKSNSENNNNYNFNNKNGDLSGLPDVEGDLIQRALFMTLNDDSPPPAELKTIENIKDTLQKSTEKLSDEIRPNSTAVATVTLTAQVSTNDISADKANIPLLRCTFCKYTHTEVKSLRNHYKRTHSHDITEDEIIGFTKNQTFKCRPCNTFETKNRSEMQKHLIDHHKIDGDFEMYCYEQQNCPACVRVFKDQRSARTHYTRVHSAASASNSNGGGSLPAPAQEQFICSACDKVFNQKASLQNHQRFCQVAQPVHCTFCESQFSTMRKYELHLQQQHAVSTVHECEICQKTFKNAESLGMHRKRHSERHFQCDQCSLNYVNAAELKVHYERTHVQVEEPVTCGSCDNKFQNFTLLREHEQRSHQQKLWRCDNCNFETSSRSRRRQHQYEHSGYPYQCEHCQEEFADRSKIRQHSKKVHDAELSDEQLAEMFRERVGYTNRHDAFAKGNVTLEIPGFSEECFNELKSLGVDYDDITNDLFSNNTSALDHLLDLIP